ncbi:putative RNA-directed DNA polymerase from transposon BS [Nephila pilipes]|uniref:Putative RNA-directed DNA polymerase from transposon BS n=1 Tax=Nephila pilipes TaxID=299642 RepID=A0A8X6R7U4_NEPPI|nr:putative RNA-directed DNA polymerase from transposon BS [Nephila pilipes]
MCSKIDSRSSDSKLWKLVKNIHKEQEQFATCNSVRDAAGQAYPDDKSAANGLATHYQSSSRFNFSFMNRSILKRARNVIHGCRSSDFGDPMLAKPFSSQDFLLALALLDLKKSPGPDGLHSQMLENLGTRGKQRLLRIINLSWKIG